MNEKFAQLSAEIEGVCTAGQELAPLTTWKVGGPAQFYVEAYHEKDVCCCLDFARTYAVPVTVIGNGSNLLIRDGGVRGIVLRLGGTFKSFRFSGRELTAGAAVGLPRLSRGAAERGLSGLEFAAGIPATVGGGVVMNAGTPAGELGDVVTAVEVVDRRGKTQQKAGRQLGFGYRSSNINPKEEIVLRVALSLHPADKDTVKAATEQQLSRRREAQPLNIPNAGSVFKNPPGEAAGRLIEAAGLKGRKVGGAEVSAKHANFIVNTGSAKAEDILALIRIIQDEVAAAFNISLEPEIQIIGEEK